MPVIFFTCKRISVVCGWSRTWIVVPHGQRPRSFFLIMSYIASICGKVCSLLEVLYNISTCVSVRTHSWGHIEVNVKLFKASAGWLIMSPPKTSGLSCQGRRGDWIWKATGSLCHNFIFLIMKEIYRYSINIRKT